MQSAECKSFSLQTLNCYADDMSVYITIHAYKSDRTVKYTFLKCAFWNEASLDKFFQFHCILWKWGGLGDS